MFFPIAVVLAAVVISQADVPLQYQASFDGLSSCGILSSDLLTLDKCVPFSKGYPYLGATCHTTSGCAKCSYCKKVGNPTLGNQLATEWTGVQSGRCVPDEDGRPDEFLGVEIGQRCTTDHHCRYYPDTKCVQANSSADPNSPYSVTTLGFCESNNDTRPGQPGEFVDEFVACTHTDHCNPGYNCYSRGAYTPQGLLMDFTLNTDSGICIRDGECTPEALDYAVTSEAERLSLSLLKDLACQLRKNQQMDCVLPLENLLDMWQADPLYQDGQVCY